MLSFEKIFGRPISAAGTGCYGRECKLGWGYNQVFDQLIPVKGEPNVTLNIANKPWCNVYNLTSADVEYRPHISLFLEQSYKRLLDFGIVFDDNQYWQIHYSFIVEVKKSRQLPIYPEHCTFFINEISYGMELWVQFPKLHFPQERDEMSKLFEKAIFHTIQKQVKCKVLINYNEVREMTLNDLMQLIKQIKEGSYFEYHIPVTFSYGKLNSESRECIVSNESEFVDFLSSLYRAYRKIEMKIKNIENLDIFSYPYSKGETPTQISSYLKEMKEKYNSMDENSFVDIYPILKELFFWYINYIRCTLDYGINMNEGKCLPGSTHEIKHWLQKLNTWVPNKVDEKKITEMKYSTEKIPHSEQAIEKIHKTYELDKLSASNENKKEQKNNVVYEFSFEQKSSILTSPKNTVIQEKIDNVPGHNIFSDVNLYIEKDAASITYKIDGAVMNGFDSDESYNIPVAIALLETPVIGSASFKEENKWYLIPLTPIQFVNLLDDSYMETVMKEFKNDPRVRIDDKKLQLIVRTSKGLRNTTLSMLLAIFIKGMIKLIPDESRQTLRKLNLYIYREGNIKKNHQFTNR